MGLIMLDLDGTLVADALVEVSAGDGKTKLERRQHELYTAPTLLDNRLNVLSRAAEEGDSFAIVTNQGGVAWGYHTQAECYERIACTLRQLAFFGGRPFSVHVCFAHERATVSGFKAGAERRKPSAAMLLEAVHAHDPPGSDWVSNVGRAPGYVMVGNHQVDEEAALAAGIDYVSADEFFAA